MLEPRPCPFCASIDIQKFVDDGDDLQEQGYLAFSMGCLGCSTCGPPARLFFDKVPWPVDSREFAEHGVEQAIIEWNERANDMIGSRFGQC